MAKAIKRTEMAGAKELDKALSVFIPKVQNKILRKAARMAGKIVAAAAADNAPVGDEEEYDNSPKGKAGRTPGQLKKSFRVRALPRSRTTQGVGISSSKDLFKGEAFYGGFLEFGWVTHRGRKEVEPKPFLRPALYDNANEVNHIFLTVGKQEIDKITAEARRESGGDRIIRQ